MKKEKQKRVHESRPTAQATYRKRKEALGLVYYSGYSTPENKEKILAYAKELEQEN